MSRIVQTIERVTPTMAQKFLETSQGNRPISSGVVKSYAATMENGDWKVNGVPIVFDNGGHLVDGHHRLQALIEADRSIELTIVRGVEPDVFTTFDCGRHRNLGQILAMCNVPDYNKVSGIVSISIALERYGAIRKNNGTNVLKMTNDIYYSKFKKDPDSYLSCTKFAEKLYRVARILRMSWVGGMLYYLTHTGSFSEEFVKKFFSAVCNLETSGINPADELRKFILRNSRNNGAKKLDDSYLFAIVAKAWNAYVNGTIIGRFKFNPNTEEYPKLRLNPIP